jgi:hypothetical protein
MNAYKALTGFALVLSGALIAPSANGQSGDALQAHSGLLRSQSTYTWTTLDSESLAERIAVRRQNANLMYRLGAQELIVDRAFDVSQQRNLPRSLQFYREGHSFGQRYTDNSTRDPIELKHYQITWLSRLLYTSNPAELKALIEKLGPVLVELTASPHNFSVRVTDDQYAGGDFGHRQTTLSAEVIGNLVYVLDRLDKDPKLASMKSELRSQAMAILNHPMTVEYFASTLSHGLLDGYSERGIHLRRYFELVAVAQPGIWKSIVAKIEANPDMLPTSMLVLKYWTTRDLKYFRRLLIDSQWPRSEVFASGIPGYEPYQIIRSNPELLELTVLRALEGLSPLKYYAGAVLSAAEASARIENGTKEHRLIAGIRSRLPNADHALRAIGNLFLAAGPEGRMYLGPYQHVSVNQNFLEIAMQEAKKQGIESIDVRLLASAAADFSATKPESDILRHLRYLFGKEKIDAIIRSAFNADDSLVRRQPLMDGRRRYGQGIDTDLTSSFRGDVRTGALVDLMARKLLTIEDVDMIFKDMASGYRWLNALSGVYDSTILANLKETIRETLKSNGYEGGRGFARYLRERHGLSVPLTTKDATVLQASEQRVGANVPKLIYSINYDQAVLTNKAGNVSMKLLEALAAAGYLSINDRNKTTGTMYIGISNNRYHPDIAQRQILETNSFVSETYANWMREAGYVPSPAIARPVTVRSAVNALRGGVLGCEGSFVSTK